MTNRNIFLAVTGILILLIALWKLSESSQDKKQINNQSDQNKITSKQDKMTDQQSEKKFSAPPMNIDTKKSYTAILTTSEGGIEIELNISSTPKTVNNFVYLAKEGLYNETVFHRVINGFMIQGGDPSGDGTGGPGYRFDDEPFEGEYTRGTVAMANAGPNTNGSQFFIMHADTPLPKNYVIFGKVTKGIDVVDRIATAPVTSSSSGEESRPVTPVKIESVEIIEKQ